VLELPAATGERAGMRYLEFFAPTPATLTHCRAHARAADESLASAEQIIVGRRAGYPARGRCAMSAPLDIHPDMAQAAADFAELRTLSARFGFDLLGTLDSLADSGTPVFAADVDFLPAPSTGHLVARYKLAERLRGALAALRVTARNREKNFPEIDHNSPSGFFSLVDSGELCEKVAGISVRHGGNWPIEIGEDNGPNLPNPAIRYYRWRIKQD
jgi:hypothetical protein